jgi:methylamine---glutamate N-methyltransferase subunit C
MESESMTRWVCTVCGYVHEGPDAPEECPVCGATADLFEEDSPAETPSPPEANESLADYLAPWAREGAESEPAYTRIQRLARTGHSEVSAMGSQAPFPGWESVLFKGAQLFQMPLNDDKAVSTKTIIGKTAAKPMALDIPFYVSHMSFGALSKEAKIALARGSRLMGTGIGSGEGGLLPEEREEASHYIYELGTAPFSHRDEAIVQADAVEIKIGQAAKPGLGGHLPAEKATEEIARVRGIPVGESSTSPGRYTGLNTIDDLIQEVARVRELLDGKPVGVKLAAGHIEEDLALALKAAPDFITLDCRGGGTGAAPNYIKDHVCVPAVFAVHRARKFLDSVGSPVTLCITGGFRDSTDIAKALAMGADAVALATASLMAIGCQQYRVCHTGKCPVGITTHDPELRKRLQLEASVQRFVNFYTATGEELRTLARIHGHSDIHSLATSDLMTISNEISNNTDLAHV